MSRRWLPSAQLVLPVLSALLLLGLWVVAHDLTVAVPSPGEVVAAVPDFLAEGNVLGNVLLSAHRVAVGLGIALVAAVLTVTVMLSHERLGHILETYVLISLATPSAAAALFALIVFGLSNTGVYLVVALITYPFITAGVKGGAMTVDRNLLQMCDVYELGWASRLRHLIIPHIAPWLLGSVRNAHALGWKIAIVTEIFLARGGIGGEFNRAFSLFNLEDTILWLGVLLSVLLLIEYGLLRPLERHIYRWRPLGVRRAGALRV